MLLLDVTRYRIPSARHHATNARYIAAATLSLLRKMALLYRLTAANDITPIRHSAMIAAAEE